MQSARVARAADIPEGGMRKVVLDGEPVLVANIDGSFYAIANACRHRGGDLSGGSLEDGIVTCPVHGSRFDVRTGKNVSGPRVLGITWKTGDVRSYRVRLDGEDVVIDSD